MFPDYLFDGLQRFREQRFRALADNSPDMICRYDRTLQLVYANNMAETLIGRVALPPNCRTRADDPDPFAVAAQRSLERVFQTGAQQLVKVDLQTVLGLRTFEARMSPEVAADGSIQSVTVAARDVTEHERVELERKGVYQQLLARQEELRHLIQQLISGREVEGKRSRTSNQLDLLTSREQRVMRLVACGWSNKRIADELGLSAGTVKNVIARLLDKLQVSDRTQAAVLTVRLGLLDDRTPAADTGPAHL